SAARVPATPTVVTPAPSKPAQRTVTFASLRPAFGVRMTIDGAPAPDPDANTTLTLDDKAHTLVFSCAGDRCAPKTITIPPGEKGEALTVELAILPAKLVVEGDPSHSYGIEELPSITIAAGQEIDV